MFAVSLENAVFKPVSSAFFLSMAVHEVHHHLCCHSDVCSSWTKSALYSQVKNNIPVTMGFLHATGGVNPSIKKTQKT